MTPISEEQAFLEAGVTAHNAGDLENAEVNYRKSLALNPFNPDALHLLGFLAFQMGFAEEAISLIQDAIELSPRQPYYFNKLATIYVSIGDQQKAIEAYRSSYRIKKNDPDVLNDLGNLLIKSAETTADGKALQEATKFLRKAIKINPARAEYHNNLGNALRNQGLENIDKARKCYNHALRLNPHLSGVVGNLGLLAQLEGDLDLAEDLFGKAVEQAPDDPEALNNYAQSINAKNRIEEAIEYFSKAEALDPKNITIRMNKARSLMHIRRDQEAMTALQQVMELDPSKFEPYWYFAITLRKMELFDDGEKFIGGALEQFPDNINLRHELAAIFVARLELSKAEALLQGIIDEVGDAKIVNGAAGLYATLGVVYLTTGTPEQVIAMFKQALDFEPDNKTAQNNYALSLICLGMLKEGWSLYKDRWKSEDFSSPTRPFQKPLWDGLPQAGKTIALWGEQGIGDEIRFASMLPDVMGKGENLVIECDPRLVDLFARSFEGLKIYPRELDLSAPIEDTCDFQLPIADLGGMVRPSIESFPQERYAYLKPDPKRIDFWRGRFAELGTRPKIGILWRSMLVSNSRSPHYASIDDIEPILKIEGVDFINLMYAECSEDRAQIAQQYGVDIHTWDDIDLKDDQDDLAALIANVDIVVCPMTATGNLAAAIDKPVFCFITDKRSPELLGHPDAPGWAPSMRHFIKSYEEPWDQVMSNITAELKRTFNLS